MTTACGTTVVYNGIEIRNVLTDAIDCETVYDSTGVDPIGVRTRMTFTGELWGKFYDGREPDLGHTWSAPSPANTNLAGGVYDTIQQFLLPRQLLLATIGNTVLFQVRPGGAARCSEPEPGTPVGGTPTRYDINNGPRTTCKVLAVKGTRSAKCQFSIEFTTALRCGNEQQIGHILNVRWTVLDDIDCTMWLTRRVYQGRIRFRCRSDEVNPHIVARHYVFPPISSGFRRESISYHEEPNALEMTFQIVDQETGFAAPSPATHWEGSYSMIFPQHGIAMEQEINLVLRADKNCRLPNEPVGYRVKQHLATLATYIIEAKLHWTRNRSRTSENPGNFFLTSANFTENLVENEIRVNCRAIVHSADAWAVNMRSFKAVNSDGLPLVDMEFGLPLGASFNLYPNRPRARGDYNYNETTIPESLSGVATSLLCLLQNPCCVQELGAAGTVEEPTSITYSPQTSAPRESVIVKYENEAQYSETHNASMYQFYRMSSDIIGDTGWRGFPTGQQCSETTNQVTVAFAHLHCPVQIRKVTIHATRVNAWPELIRPVHWRDPETEITHVLAHYTVEPLPVQLSADGRDTLHEVLATYFYYLDRPYRVESAHKFPVGKLPYVAKAGLKVGVVTKGNQDGDASAIDQQFFLEPAELLALNAGR